MLVEGNTYEGDHISFDPELKHLRASAYSYQISSSGYCEIDEAETREIYEQMKKVFEPERCV